MIDWGKCSSPVSAHFTVSECLYLPKWNRLANEHDGLNDEIKGNLILLCTKLDTVRDFFKKPMIVHCMYRPKEYNSLIGGAVGSAHIEGLAIDFHVINRSCDEVREMLLPLLEQWKFRMEDLPGSNWVHLDLRDPGYGNRFFKP